MSSPIPSSGRLAGIDYGTVRVGVAITDPDRRLASPHSCWTRRDRVQDARWFKRFAEDERIEQEVLAERLARRDAEAAQRLGRRHQRGLRLGWLRAVLPGRAAAPAGPSRLNGALAAGTGWGHGRAPPSRRSTGLSPSASSNPATLRHPMRPVYRCFLPDLTELAGHRRAGPGSQHYVTVTVSRCRPSGGHSAPL